MQRPLGMMGHFAQDKMALLGEKSVFSQPDCFWNLLAVIGTQSHSQLSPHSTTFCVATLAYPL